MCSDLAMVLLAAIAAETPATAPRITVTRVEQPPVPITDDQPGLGGMSGLVWLGGGRYAIAGDDGGAVYVATIEVGPDTGRIINRPTAATLFEGAGKDLEGIAYDPARKTLLLADERTTRIDRRTMDGGRVGGIAAPAVLHEARGNRSLESLARGDDGTVWTANEIALEVDGGPATAETGTVVRLQRFDAGGEPDGQWAYVTEPLSGSNPMNRHETVGLVELLILPTGELLALEREFAGLVPGNRNRLYLVDVTDATDTSTLRALADAGYRPAHKALLIEIGVPETNIEGMTLGPTLADGSRSMLLVSDDNAGRQPQVLVPLRIQMQPPRQGDADRDQKPQTRTDSAR